MEARRALVQQDTPSLSVRQKCEALGVHRSTLFYKPRPIPMDEVEVMNRIQDLYVSKPFLGYRRITYFLQKEGILINKTRSQVDAKDEYSSHISDDESVEAADGRQGLSLLAQDISSRIL